MDYLIAALQKVVSERGVRYYTLTEDGYLIVGPTGDHQVASEVDLVTLEAHLALIDAASELEEDHPED